MSRVEGENVPACALCGMPAREEVLLVRAYGGHEVGRQLHLHRACAQVYLARTRSREHGHQRQDETAENPGVLSTPIMTVGGEG